jgi:hypothetical protein
MILKLILVLGVSVVVVFSDIAEAGDLSPEMLVGLTTCNASSKYALNGSFVPFDKDPSAFSFGDTSTGSSRYILVIRNPPEPGKCGEIVAGMKINRQQLLEGKSAIGFNCAALKQPFGRSKSYLGIYKAEALEYTRTKVAWRFDFDTMKFESYPLPWNIYCANFIAD